MMARWALGMMALFGWVGGACVVQQAAPETGGGVPTKTPGAAERKNEAVRGEKRGEKGREAEGEGTRWLTVASHVAGCEAGARGRAEIWYEETRVAEVSPGESVKVPLPREADLLNVTTGEAARTTHLFWSEGPVVMELGCRYDAVGALALLPVVFEGRPSCEEEAPLRFRVAGLDIGLEAGQFYTVFLPRGEHEAVVLGSRHRIRVEDEMQHFQLDACEAGGAMTAGGGS